MQQKSGAFKSWKGNGNKSADVDDRLSVAQTQLGQVLSGIRSNRLDGYVAIWLPGRF